MGFNYQVTQFRGSVIVAALRVSNGSVDAFPMRQIMQVFGPLAVDTANRNTALLMLGEFVPELSLEPSCLRPSALRQRRFSTHFPNRRRNQGAAGSSSRPSARTS